MGFHQHHWGVARYLSSIWPPLLAFEPSLQVGKCGDKMPFTKILSVYQQDPQKTCTSTTVQYSIVSHMTCPSASIANETEWISMNFMFLFCSKIWCQWCPSQSFQWRNGSISVSDFREHLCAAEALSSSCTSKGAKKASKPSFNCRNAAAFCCPQFKKYSVNVMAWCKKHHDNL